MNILILNGSPSGNSSITLQTAEYIMALYPKHHYEILHVGQQIRRFEKDIAEACAALERAELIVFCYPVYTFLAPAQLHRFIELMKESGVDLSDKYATQLTTSKHFYDSTAHCYVADNCADMGLRCIRGLSADMEDLLSKQGQRDARVLPLCAVEHPQGVLRARERTCERCHWDRESVKTQLRERYFWG